MSSHPATILIIDDNTADILLLRRGLDRQGQPYRLEVLTDGAAAMQFVHEHRTAIREPKPCVILLDLQLPVHNGLEILQAIQREPAIAHIQVVVLTSFASPTEEAKVRDMGAICRLKPTGLDGYDDLAAAALEICKSIVLT